MIKTTINSNDQNKRLDNFIKKYLQNAPSSFIYKLFRKKDVKVNGKPQKIDYITKLNDEITIYVTDTQLEEFKRTVSIKESNAQDFSVVYEDDNILVVNKPAGLLVHEGESKNDDTLSNQVVNYLIRTNQYDPSKENTFIPSLAHRIDRNTSGIVVFGKTLLALQELFQAFKEHEKIDKQYLCLVAGRPEKEGVVDVPLIKNEKTKIVNVDLKNGLSALSKYSVEKYYADVSLMRVFILTGRTHQIRVHMKYINHPLIGDGKYGNQESDNLAKKYGMKNLFLHASKLCFYNLTGSLEYLNGKVFTAPLYKWQKELIERIEKYGTISNKS